MVEEINPVTGETSAEDMVSNENTHHVCSCSGATIEIDVYYTFDGSLNDGMEIVTHPMSLKYHKEKMPCAEIMRSAIHMAYRSQKTSTCGLHVHVN